MLCYHVRGNTIRVRKSRSLKVDLNYAKNQTKYALFMQSLERNLTIGQCREKGNSVVPAERKKESGDISVVETG